MLEFYSSCCTWTTENCRHSIVFTCRLGTNFLCQKLVVEIFINLVFHWKFNPCIVKTFLPYSLIPRTICGFFTDSSCIFMTSWKVFSYLWHFTNYFLVTCWIKINFAPFFPLTLALYNMLNYTFIMLCSEFTPSV
jgi:hypothetical protein